MVYKVFSNYLQDNMHFELKMHVVNYWSGCCLVDCIISIFDGLFGKQRPACHVNNIKLTCIFVSY